jgi:hypothetical protein
MDFEKEYKKVEEELVEAKVQLTEKMEEAEVWFKSNKVLVGVGFFLFVIGFALGVALV